MKTFKWEKCDTCEYACKDKPILIRHKRKHSGDYATSDGGALVIHKRIHSGEPYKCVICELTSSTRTGLTKHNRTHTRGKPSKVQHPLIEYNEEVCLNRHQIKELDEHPYQCDFCEYEYVQRILNTTCIHMYTLGLFLFS